MKDTILLILAVLILAAMCIQIATQNKNDRYEVVSGSNMLTILVDKQTGETWRNCICGDKSGIPGCWEKMNTLNAENFNKPIGEVKANKKAQALYKKQAKLQEKSQSAPQQAPQQQGQPLRIGG